MQLLTYSRFTSITNVVSLKTNPRILKVKPSVSILILFHQIIDLSTNKKIIIRQSEDQKYFPNVLNIITERDNDYQFHTYIAVGSFIASITSTSVAVYSIRACPIHTWGSGTVVGI